MEFYCTESFFREFKRLEKNASYSDIYEILINDILNGKLDFFKNAIKLTGSTEMPFLKKRIKGSGGYRIYLLLVIKEDKICLSFIHPKTGPHGAENITEKAEKQFFKESIDCYKNKSGYKITKDKHNIQFEKLNVIKPT